MLRNLLLLCILPMMSCIKYMYFTDTKTNAEIIELSKIWVVERDEGQALRVALRKSSPKAVFIKWDSARIKIGDNEPVGVNVRPNYQVSVLSPTASVFEVIPLIEFERSAKFLYPKTYIVSPETLKRSSQKVMISIEVCEGDIEDGFRSIDCADGSDYWSKRILQGMLTFGSRKN